MTSSILPVLISRHPQVEGASGLCYGRREMTLGAGWEAGAAGLMTLARGIGCAVIHTSPSSRCRIVAKMLEDWSGLPVCSDDRLRELDFGQWEGRAWEDVPRAALEDWAADPEGFYPPEGESGRKLQERIQSFWKDLLRAGQPALILSHGGPLRLLDGLARGMKPNLMAPSMPQGSSRLFYVSV